MPRSIVLLATLLVAGTVIADSNTAFAQVESTRSWIVRAHVGTDPDVAVAELGASLDIPGLEGQTLDVRRDAKVRLSAGVGSHPLSRYRIVTLPDRITPTSGATYSVHKNHTYSIPASRSARSTGVTLGANALPWNLDTIRIDEVWEIEEGDPSIVVGIIDTGIEPDHPEFDGRFAINAPEDLNGNGRFDPWPSDELVDGLSGDLDGLDQDGNGYIDDVAGYDFVDQVAPNLGDAQVRDPIVTDEQGHGTQVAGVVAAGRGGTDVTGVAPGVRILPVRAFDQVGDGEDDDIATAIVYAVDRGVRVLNLSFGDTYRSPLLADAIAYARSNGVLVVASSGNDGVSDPHYPSDLAGVMSVGATTDRGTLSLFSGFGSLLSMVAPGDGIKTTDLGGGTAVVSGTSFSAPHVAGVAALLLSRDPRLTAEEVRGMLETGSADRGLEGWDLDFGAGRLDAAGAFDRPRGITIGFGGPRNDTGVADGLLRVAPRVAGPGLKSWSVAYGLGRLPTTFVPVVESTVTSINQGYDVDLSAAPDTTVVIRIQARFSDGLPYESRRRIVVDRTEPKIESVELDSIWIGERRGLALTVETDDRSTVELLTTTSSGESRIVASEEGRTGVGRRHYLIIGPRDISPGDRVSISLKVTNLAGLSTLRDLGTVSMPNEAFSDHGWTRSDVSLPYAYLPRDLDPQDTLLVINEFQGLSFDRTVAYAYEEGIWSATDTLGSYVPRGIGDVDGDGRRDVLLQANGTGLVTTSGDDVRRPFERVLFADTLSRTFFPGGLADVEGDGRSEIIGVRGSLTGEAERVVVWSFGNGRLTTVAEGVNPTDPEPGVSQNSFGASDVVVRDFDGDDVPEILVGDSDGDLILYAIDGSTLRPVWTRSREGIDADKMFAIGDINDNGLLDVAIATRPSVRADDAGDYRPPFWHVELIEFDRLLSATTLFEDLFDHPRPTSTFRTGISFGDLDGRPGNELAISLFPDLYVFRYDETIGQIRPFRTRSPALANAPVVVDIDRDGQNEVAVGNGQLTEFWGIDSASLDPAPPSGVTAVSNSATEIRVSWSPSEHGVRYRLYRSTGNGFSLHAETEDLEYVDGSEGNPLDGETLYSYAITAVDADGIESPPSAVVSARPYALLRFLAASTSDGRSVVVRTSGRISSALYRSGAVVATDVASDSRLSVSSILQSGDSLLVVTLAEAQQGVRVRLRPSRLLFDAFGAPADTTSSVEFETDPSGAPAFFALDASIVRDRTVRIRMSDSVDAELLTTSSVKLDPPGSPRDVAIDPSDPTSVLVTLSIDYPLGPFGYLYTFDVSGMRSVGGVEVEEGPGAIVGLSLTADDADRAALVPQPLSIAQAADSRFIRLPSAGMISIHRPSGELVRRIAFNSGDGGVPFDGRDQNDRQLKPGIYICVVEPSDPTGSSARFKFAVVP